MSIGELFVLLVAPLGRFFGSEASDVGDTAKNGHKNGKAVLPYLGIEVVKGKPYDVPPADTEYEYAFRYASFTGKVDPMEPIAAARRELQEGNPLAATDEPSKA